MPAPPKLPVNDVSEEARTGFAGLVATEREMLAKRIADAPASWISIPMWGRVFRVVRKVFGIGHEAGSKR
jgi:hypothetical protein